MKACHRAQLSNKRRLLFVQNRPVGVSFAQFKWEYGKAGTSLQFKGSAAQKKKRDALKVLEAIEKQAINFYAIQNIRKKIVGRENRPQMAVTTVIPQT